MQRKSLRGLRRHWRSHRQRATKPTELNLTVLARFQREYVKLGIAPWHNHQKPPKLFRQLWVTWLVADLHDWHTQLAAQYSDFYLAVWLFEPRFGMSQLVAAINDQKSHYQELFGPAHERALPPEYHDMPGVRDVCWTAHADVEVLWPDDFASLGTWASSKPHRPFRLANGQPCIAMQVGWVWVGQVAANAIFQS